MNMRPLWEGSISFGLILIPVKLYKATDERKPGFKLLREEDLCPIKYVRVCKSTGEEVSYDKIAKGYEYSKGDYVVLSDEDLKKAFKKRTDNINIVKFTDVDQIDSKYYERPYYIEPSKGAAKVYALLREALKKTKKAGVARYVLRNIEHLGILKAEGDLLMLNQIRFHGEIRRPEGLNIPSDEDLADNELDTAVMLIEQLAAPFEPNEFEDTYAQEIQNAIEQKVKTGQIKTREPEKEETGEVIDLLDSLKKSLDEARKKKNVS
jgi:DNA end-binding protein Ku